MDITELVASRNAFIAERAIKAAALKASFEKNEITKDEYEELAKDIIKLEVIVFELHTVDEQIYLHKALGAIEKFLSFII